MSTEQFPRWLATLACSLALLLVAGTQTGGIAASVKPQNAHWVATWATSPSFPYADGAQRRGPQGDGGGRRPVAFPPLSEQGQSSERDRRQSGGSLIQSRQRRDQA
jgi:hypothetical protein